MNDVHSQLNETEVGELLRPGSVAELQQLVRDTPRLAVCGGRHAMGGQQFAAGLPLLDLGRLDRVLDLDVERGLLHIEAGAQWPAIIAATESRPGGWAIRQKQTGVDAVSLGGSIAANAHGRGLNLQPLGDDIESLELIDACGELQRCSRSENAELFSLVIGGYGLFGIVVSARLRLTRRQWLRRSVDVLDLEDALNAVRRRISDGCLYGDFQFVIDAQDPRFLRRGVFACYQPVDANPGAEHAAELPPDLPAAAWLQLLQLAHTDKAAAFARYAQHYLGTDGQRYASDRMQLATYIPSYAEYLQEQGLGGPHKQTLLIGEHYVPPDRLPEFLQQAAALLRELGCELIYGTIRAIRQDGTAWLPWATEDLACVVFNLRTEHSEAGRARSAAAFRALTDASLGLGGRFFLTYHRHATAAQVEAGYPRIREWFAAKRRHDPQERFVSDWYLHYRQAFGA